jgi:hypothetical protein
MDISIEQSGGADSETWLVTAGSLRLYFRNQRSALEFASKLKERVDSPHSLPEIEVEAFEEVAEMSCTG